MLDKTYPHNYLAICNIITQTELEEILVAYTNKAASKLGDNKLWSLKDDTLIMTNKLANGLIIITPNPQTPDTISLMLVLSSNNLCTILYDGNIFNPRSPDRTINPDSSHWQHILQLERHLPKLTNELTLKKRCIDNELTLNKRCINELTLGKRCSTEQHLTKLTNHVDNTILPIKWERYRSNDILKSITKYDLTSHRIFAEQLGMPCPRNTNEKSYSTSKVLDGKKVTMNFYTAGRAQPFN
jgi:hypothetical protein